jgi:hypothetical protein
MISNTEIAVGILVIALMTLAAYHDYYKPRAPDAPPPEEEGPLYW